jgi:hypothetical protein
MTLRDKNYLYSLQSHKEYGFSTGIDKQRRQVLLGILEPQLLALFFTPTGDLIMTEKRMLGSRIGKGSTPRHMPDSDLLGDHPEVVAWQEELGLVEKQILIKKFFVPLSHFQPMDMTQSQVRKDEDLIEHSGREKHAYPDSPTAETSGAGTDSKPWEYEGIGIEDVPWHHLEYLANPTAFEEEERADLSTRIQDWLDRGDFVLWWGNDYDVNKNGEVVSS